jgi:Protein of unknown function (DUF998)
VRRPLRRLATVAGLAGPGAFTAAWVVSGRRQDGYSLRNEHISGLAAPDARDPEVLIAGFVVLGAATIGFAAALRERLGGREAGLGPYLLGITGAGAIAAGLLRRDHMLLHPLDEPPDWQQSWRNNGHDLSAGVIYTTSVAAPLLLARHLARDPQLASLGPVGLGLSAASLALMGVFATQVDRRGNGIVQRVMVSLPMAFMSALAWRMLCDER